LFEDLTPELSILGPGITLTQGIFAMIKFPDKAEADISFLMCRPNPTTLKLASLYLRIFYSIAAYIEVAQLY
jgi:hypothetical protein